MPTYDYECTSCDYKFEIFQQITEKTLKSCPNCKKKKLQRLIGTGGAVIFKGSGFYQTDYRSKDYKSKKEAENKSSDTDTKKAKTKETKKATTATKTKNE